jgi:hypothetical protein
MERGGWGGVREASAYHELQSAVASKTPPQPPALSVEQSVGMVRASDGISG